MSQARIQQAIDGLQHGYNELQLQNLDITDEDIHRIIPVITSSRAVKSIDLSGNRITDAGAASLCNALRSNAEAFFEVINLNNNMIGDAGLQSIRSVIPQLMFLTELQLNGNKYSESAARELIDSIEEHGISLRTVILDLDRVNQDLQQRLESIIQLNSYRNNSEDVVGERIKLLQIRQMLRGQTCALASKPGETSGRTRTCVICLTQSDDSCSLTCCRGHRTCGDCVGHALRVANQPGTHVEFDFHGSMRCLGEMCQERLPKNRIVMVLPRENLLTFIDLTVSLAVDDAEQRSHALQRQTFDEVQRSHSTTLRLAEQLRQHIIPHTGFLAGLGDGRYDHGDGLAMHLGIEARRRRPMHMNERDRTNNHYRRYQQDRRNITLEDQQPSTLDEHVHYIENRMLCIFCPRCGLVFDEFSGCPAITCVCGCEFCAWCLAIPDSPIHMHTGMCGGRHSTRRDNMLGMFDTIQGEREMVKAAWQKLRANRLRNYWESSVSESIRDSLLERITPLLTEDLVGPNFSFSQPLSLLDGAQDLQPAESLFSAGTRNRTTLTRVTPIVRRVGNKRRQPNFPRAQSETDRPRSATDRVAGASTSSRFAEAALRRRSARLTALRRLQNSNSSNDSSQRKGGEL